MTHFRIFKYKYLKLKTRTLAAVHTDQSSPKSKYKNHFLKEGLPSLSSPLKYKVNITDADNTDHVTVISL